jgi:general L-amino acid transport system permease protein
LAGLLWQIVVVGIAVAIIAWLWSNAVHNLSVRRISTGFAFLGREAGMPIADSWLAYATCRCCCSSCSGT